MADHAKLSASGSKRWLACTPSANLEAQFPESTSVYAEEGIFAHSLGELMLRNFLAQVDNKVYTAELQKLRSNTFYSPELEDHVQAYTDIAIEKIREAKARSSDAVVLLEQRLDFSEWVPEGFGTGDLVIIADGILEVVDLKFGKGVPVSAIDNSQMRLYGIGALGHYDMLYGINEVSMTIVQPRLDNVSTETMPAAELLDWAETYVKPKAALAMDGKGDFVPGDHCKFCRAKAVCKARAAENLKVEAYGRQDPFLLTDDEIAAILTRVDALVDWAKDVQSYALEQSLQGRGFPGFKLVEGRSNRTFNDEAAVITTLLSNGFAEGNLYNRKLIGITDMEKLVGKKRFVDLLGSYIIKPPGKPTLVPMSDKRLPINSAAADFGGLMV